MSPLETLARTLAEPARKTETPPTRGIEPCALVIFGGAGDLARRKLVPALYNLGRDGALPRSFAVVGTGRTPMTAEQFREVHHDATPRYSRTGLDEATWERFAPALDYLRGDFTDATTFAHLKDWLDRADRERGTAGNRVFYFATPASGFEKVFEGLVASGLVRRGRGRPWTRVVLEKPFGRDIESARALDALLTRHIHESQIFRIDHYVGKETVQNLLVFRFGNSIFEPLWNRKYVDHVQVTAAEEIGIEGRGAFYDETGVIRDIVQNHLLQVLTLCAMEPPTSLDGDEVRDQKALVLRALRPFDRKTCEHRVVLGQYRGYRDEKGVRKDSRTPTFAALKVFVDNWRWQGVPFYIRAGKRLAKRVTEIAIHFQSIPLCLFEREKACNFAPNELILRIQPDEGISLRFACKPPGDELIARNVNMDFDYASGFAAPVHEAYERLLLDVVRGDQTLFWRSDAIELAWAFVQPILDATEKQGLDIVRGYDAGTTGPPDANELIARDERAWRPLP